MSYFQAIVIGLLQGVTELFPVSSLGHSVIVPGLLGWNNIVKAQSANESFYLAFLVGLHVATALALLWQFREDWVKIIGGFFRTLRTRHIETKDERLAWLLVVATIPAGITGLLLEHSLRTLLAKPEAASLFLFANGLILAVGERARRRSEVRALAVEHGLNEDGGRQLDTLEYKEAGVVGLAQILALFAGISRSGVTMVAGLVRGLDHEDAARFSFLLATPIILAAGVYKLPDLLGHNGNGIRGQVVVGSVVAAVSALFAVRFLLRYFRSRNLNPFALYCLTVGAGCAIYFALT
ncbi:MAG TPA: undecaprenyl-diphosphate phosphatase [Acidimicrobiia bacterium]|nr:undecaprenyl-diphosphate phosphatase [Acidimicrobiia bacterium]